MTDLTKKTKIGDNMKLHKSIPFGRVLVNVKFQRVIIFVFTFAVLYSICFFETMPQKYNLKEGDVAQSDIKAPRDFVDELATNSKKEEYAAKVPLQYNKNTNIQIETADRIKEYFQKAIEIKSTDTDEKIKYQKIAQVDTLRLSNDDVKTVADMKISQLNQVSDKLAIILNKVLARDIRADNEDDIKKAQEDLNFYIRNTTLSKKQKELCENIGITQIKPNFYFDLRRTNQMREEVKSQIEPVIIKKNQNIVLKGEVVTSEHIYLMKKCGLIKDNNIVDVQIYSGIGITVFVVMTLIYYFLFSKRKETFSKNNNLLLVSITLCVNALFSAVLCIISPYLIPAGIATIITALVYDSYLSVIVGMPMILINAFITGFSYEIVLLSCISVITSAIFMHRVQQRNNIVSGGIYTGLFNFAVIMSIGLINNNDFYGNLINSLTALIGGLITSILAIGILPILEQMFDIITPLKLLELSNPNQPLLKKMLFEAPGTYHHSILVANLSEAAADTIGANPLMSRVGAYYHDIGKIKRPYFFKENQIGDDNPHDKITPKLSTMIITSHVKDGVELCRKNKLPGKICDIIEQHHGTTLAKYFFVIAQNEGNEEALEKDFRYAGPKPESKEAAVVMLADSVEAAVRSISKPTLENIEKTVDKIISDKISDGQMDNTELTLRDFTLIKQSFIKILTGMYHSRIEYPEFENDKSKEQKNDIL